MCRLVEPNPLRFDLAQRGPLPTVVLLQDHHRGGLCYRWNGLQHVTDESAEFINVAHPNAEHVIRIAGYKEALGDLAALCDG